VPSLLMLNASILSCTALYNVFYGAIKIVPFVLKQSFFSNLSCNLNWTVFITVSLHEYCYFIMAFVTCVDSAVRSVVLFVYFIILVSSFY